MTQQEDRVIERLKGLFARCFIWLAVKLKLVTIEVISQPVYSGKDAKPEQK
jgi:hypothetical protein